MKLRNEFIKRRHKRLIVRFLSTWLVLFTINQAFVIPLFLSVFFLYLNEPKSQIGLEMERLAEYKKETNSEPFSLSEINSSEANNLVLTTSSSYLELRRRHIGMIVAEKKPRRRLLLPFPIGLWTVFGVDPEGDEDTGQRVILSDWETRRVCAYIAKQEGGCFDFAASFFSDALIYVFWISTIIFYVRRQKKKKIAELTTLERFSRFRDACLAYRDQTGRFPATFEELEVKEATEFQDAFSHCDFLCLSSLDVGVIGATSKPWRAPWGFGRRTYVALEDGSIVTVRGRRAVDFFYDVLWAAERWKNVGRFYLSTSRLQFTERELKIGRVLRIDRFLTFAFLTVVFLTPTILVTIYFGGGGVTPRYVWGICLAFGFSICLFLGIIPLPIVGFYTFIAHSVWGWI